MVRQGQDEFRSRKLALLIGLAAACSLILIFKNTSALHEPNDLSAPQKAAGPLRRADGDTDAPVVVLLPPAPPAPTQPPPTNAPPSLSTLASRRPPAQRKPPATLPPPADRKACEVDKLQRFLAHIKADEKRERLFSMTQVNPLFLTEDLVQPRKRKVGASIPVHPPKFYALYGFLREWIMCPAAFEVLSVYVVFSNKQDEELFDQVIECASPRIPRVWTSVVAITPKMGWRPAFGAGNQYIAAYKKWFGIMAMMDLGEEEYGLMIDSECSMYDTYAKNGTGTACSKDGAWSRLLARITAQEATKEFPAARVSSTLASYSFGGGMTMNGKFYDQHLMRDTATWAGATHDCRTKGCQLVADQIDTGLFSWWTDLPWLNLKTVERILPRSQKMEAPVRGKWREWSAAIIFPRFEYVGYQQICMIHEGFTIRDVTDITKEAKWGSYLEDPQPGSQFGQLKPMWVSADALERSENGIVGPLSLEEPPLLIFHADHVKRFSTGGEDMKGIWEQLLLDLLELQKRTDYDKSNIA